MNSKLIYDVGLHRGEDTDYYLKKGFHVIAIEANPDLISDCKIRFQDAIACKRLHIIEGAIAPENAGSSIVFYKNAKSEWGTVDPDWANRNIKLGFSNESIKLDRVDIIHAYQTFGIPFYLKIDVEGVDKLILESLRGFDERPQYVSIESDKCDINSVKDELNLLVNLGYNKFKVVQQGTIPGKTLEIENIDKHTFCHTFENSSSGPFGEDIQQPWMSYDETLEAYKKIFVLYRYFGDDSLFSKLPSPIRRVIDGSYKVVTGYRGPLPGWFDTHASL